MSESNTGLFTAKQRAWLKGERELSDSNEGNYRSRVKSQLNAAISQDLRVLNEHVDQGLLVDALELESARKKPEGDREHVREAFGWGGVEFAPAHPDIAAARVELVVLLYRLSGGLETFEELIEDGVAEVFARYNQGAVLEDVDLTIEYKLTERLLSEAKQRIRQGDPLTPSQTLAALESAEIADEKVGQHVREHDPNRV